MGTSRSGSVGSSTRWKKNKDAIKALASALAGIPLSIPQSIPPDKKSGPNKTGGLLPAVSPPLTKGGLGGVPASIPQGAAAMVPRSIRGLGKRLVAAGSADTRFAPQVGDCAVKVAIEVLIAFFTGGTIKYRLQRDTDKLFAEYGISGARNVATALAKALDQRYREELIKKCKKATDSAEKARQAMQRTLIDVLSPDGTPSAFSKLTAAEIHKALPKTNSMKIVERFYANYLYSTMEHLVSSLQADITHTAEKDILAGLRVRYCDYVAKEIVKRAGEKGWRPSEVPDKADEWQDLLVEAEEAHV
jgi:hypothetical protein